jgi:osomolarity two-component system response regulator SSK1
VADLLSGHAAQAGVDLVLFHGDASIKHISVTGDGEGLGYMLSHVSGPGPSGPRDPHPRTHPRSR